MQYLQYLLLLSGLFFGWSLGANDAGNVFGAAVATRVIKYRTATIIISVFVILGACTSGYQNITKISGFAQTNGVDLSVEAFLVLLAAAVTVTTMTVLRIPVSASQCVIGALVGWGISCNTTDWGKTGEFVIAWLINPFIGVAICFVLTFIVTRFLEKSLHKLIVYDYVIKIGYWIAGIFASYTMGVNNVAYATGMFVGDNNLLQNRFIAAILGSAAIAIGVLTFSRRVMTAIGTSVTQLTDLTGLLVVISSALAIITSNKIMGVPVPIAHATIGALIGTGLVRGADNVNFKSVKNILIAWVVSPTSAGFLTFLMGTVYKAIIN